MPPAKKKTEEEEALCPCISHSVMNACMYCARLPVDVCPFMHAKCLTVPDHHQSATRPLWSDTYQPAPEPILLTTSKEHKSNPMFHLCVCHPLPLRGNLAILTSTNSCCRFLTHPTRERSIQIIISRKHTVGSLPSFTCFFFFPPTFSPSGSLS